MRTASENRMVSEKGVLIAAIQVGWRYVERKEYQS